MRSVGNGHGEQGEVPDGVDLDDAELVGDREVTMEYPEERDTEEVARLCPFCELPFRGKQGVMIHIGQTAGRKNHPEGAAEQVDADDLPIAHVDENDNVIEIIEEPGESVTMPSTERRRGRKSMPPDEVERLASDLREKGLDEEAEKLERLIGD